MQLTDLAFGQSHDADPCKAQAFENRSDVCLVSTQAIQRLRQDQINPSFLGCIE